jgi:hypothetical protein
MRSVAHVPTRTDGIGCSIEFNHDSQGTDHDTVTISKSQMSNDETRSERHASYHDDDLEAELEGGYKMKPLRVVSAAGAPQESKGNRKPS